MTRSEKTAMAHSIFSFIINQTANNSTANHYNPTSQAQRLLESSSKSQSKDRLSWLERRVRQHWLAVFVIFGRDEVEVLDEPSRSAYGRTIERETLGTTVVARARTLRALAVATYRGSGYREPEDVSEGDRRRLEF
ncbi:hypothetical protein T11_12022 [Trichinella zimbabwensis]|uniref:Uncharacterized protein n=1 Tax=Trichinella zimbabwensis TaxID=268475 RepID=A0A0V1GXA2_9BILA|nr:hypothetical protein T11_12022 [Trichinella zimbabwensis]